MSFGVRTRHGFPEPWFEGATPATELANNQALSGTAAWTGRLIGFTPEENAVAGAAELTIDLPALTGDLDFHNLEYWTSVSPQAPGTGLDWGTTALNYQVSVTGNTFIQTGGDDGLVTGVFAGPAHEGMGGVLDRADLTAAFAGTR